MIDHVKGSNSLLMLKIDTQHDGLQENPLLSPSFQACPPLTPSKPSIFGSYLDNIFLEAGYKRCWVSR